MAGDSICNKKKKAIKGVYRNRLSSKMRAYWGKRRILLANICIATKKGDTPVCQVKERRTWPSQKQ